MKLFKYKFLCYTLSLLLIGCQPDSKIKTSEANKKTVINIKGSDTEFMMVKKLAEAYTKQHPEVIIQVESGGSNSGIKALMNNSIEICNSSKEISEKEINMFKESGDELIPIIFAMDALAIITNYKVGVDSLSLQQISNIYSCSVKNWKELGGDDLPIRLFGREKSSGTRDYFTAKFLPENNNSAIKELATNAEVVDAITNTPGAIGYVGAGFLFDKSGKPNGKLWAMPIYITNHNAISPYESALVKRGEYILSRPLYQYIKNKPTSQIENFILFELTKIGQDIILEHGYYSITDYQKEINKLKGLPF